MMSSSARIGLIGGAVVVVAVGGWAVWRHSAEGSVVAGKLPAPSASVSAAPSANSPFGVVPPPLAYTLRPGEKSTELLSPVYTVDKIYRSMTGPQNTRDISLIEADKPKQRLWITGIHANMVGPTDKTPMPPEFMCHCNLDLDPLKQDEAYGHHLPLSGRLFTLSQGQIDVQLPEGFGIPVWSDEPISLTTQVLNLNYKGETFQVRHDVDIDFVADSDAKKPMKPVFMAGVFGLALLQGAHGGFDEDKPSEHGASCMMGKAASDASYTDKQGKEFTGHWIVKPGREENHTPVTKILALPFDTTVHYIAVHLHPFAESLTLRDTTTNTVVFESKTKQLEGKIGLDRVESFSSAEGVKLFKDHEYELVSIYNNTSGVDQDSMAVMLLYLLDQEFTRDPKPAPAGAASAAPASAPKPMGGPMGSPKK